MQKDEGIARGKRPHRLHGSFCALISQAGVAMHDQEPFVAACHLRINARRIAHSVHTVIAEMRHLLCKRDILRRKFCHAGRIEHLRAVRIDARLDRRQRRKGVLRHRVMIVEDDALGKKAHEVRHRLEIAALHLGPAKGVDKDVQHELFALGAVPKAYRLAQDKRRIRSNLRALVQAKEARDPLAERRAVLSDGTALKDDLLLRHGSRQGHDDLRHFRRRVRRSRKLRRQHRWSRKETAP